MTLVSTAWTPHHCVKFSFDVSKSSCDGHASKSSRTINVIMRAAPFCHLLEPECFVLFAVSMVCIHQQQFNCFYLRSYTSLLVLASQKMKVADALLGRMQKKTGSGKVERSKLGGCWVRVGWLRGERAPRCEQGENLNPGN